MPAGWSSAEFGRPEHGYGEVDRGVAAGAYDQGEAGGGVLISLGEEGRRGVVDYRIDLDFEVLWKLLMRFV